ncbi:MAG: hypothetical protein JRG79_11930 [Deltaproteobacteria bacterium]|nr:hypothetical protein [Deltaproteobacteria bacterium]
MRTYKKSILLSIFIYFVDALFYGQGGIALITAVIIVFFLFPKILIALFRKEKKRAREGMIRAGIYAFMVVMVFLTNFCNSSLAARRAENLIQAASLYKSKNNQYPKNLEALVPDFIPEIPAAKFTLSYNRFLYHYREGNPVLFYYVVPPFGRRVYNFQNSQWGTMD